MEIFSSTIGNKYVFPQQLLCVRFVLRFAEQRYKWCAYAVNWRALRVSHNKEGDLWGGHKKTVWIQKNGNLFDYQSIWGYGSLCILTGGHRDVAIYRVCSVVGNILANQRIVANFVDSNIFLLSFAKHLLTIPFLFFLQKKLSSPSTIQFIGNEGVSLDCVYKFYYTIISQLVCTWLTSVPSMLPWNTIMFMSALPSTQHGRTKHSTKEPSFCIYDTDSTGATKSNKKSLHSVCACLPLFNWVGSRVE